MSILPSASSGAFSVLPLVLRCSTASDPSISLSTAEYAAPYTWKPPPGVAVPSTTVVFCCAATSLKPPLMIANASAKIAGATCVRRPPSPVCLFMFVLSHFPPRVDSRAALLYHARAGTPAAALKARRKPSRRSFRARAGVLDHAGPFLGFGVHEFTQFLGRAARGLRALVRQLRAQFRCRERRDERLVESLDDRARSAGGRDHRVPGSALHRGKTHFRRGRHLGQQRRARRGGDREGLQAPRFHVRQERRNGVEGDLHLARHHLGQRLRDSLVGHV